MNYLSFRSRTSETRVLDQEVRHIAMMAEQALARELAQPGYSRLRAELGLPAPDTTDYTWRVSRLASDGESRRVQGHDVYLFELALTTWHQRQPAAGVLCWLYSQALGHGWIAAADRQAFAAEIQAALTAGIARPATGWEDVCSLLHSGTGDVVTSLPGIGNAFPGSQLALEAGTWTPGLPGPDDSDEIDALWDQVRHDGQWKLCMRALYARSSRQWRPGRYCFGDFTLDPQGGLVPVQPEKLTAADRNHRQPG